MRSFYDLEHVNINGEAKIRLYHAGGYEDIDFRPYLYSDTPLSGDGIITCKKQQNGLYRVEFRNTQHLRQHRGKHTHEDDILFKVRFCIDAGIHWATDLKFVALDIECSGLDPDREEILVATLYDGEHMTTFSAKQMSEKKLLSSLMDSISKYDALITYNGDGFDLPFIKRRIELLGMQTDIEVRESYGSYHIHGRRKVAHVDVYKMVTGLLHTSINSPDNTLESVVESVFGKKKKYLSYDEQKTAWKDNPEELIKYNQEDVRYTWELFFEFKPLYDELIKLVRRPLSDVTRMSAGQVVESYLMRIYHRRGRIIPKKIKRTHEKYKGAIVLEPTPGLYNGIFVVDFKSLYPSIIIKHNIDLDTLYEPATGDEKVPDFNYGFRKDSSALLPSVLKELIETRDVIKHKLKHGHDPALWAQQYALKVLANSFYGYLAYPGSRWYDSRVAAAVTSWARHYILSAKQIAESMGTNVIYADTDSLFITSATYDEVQRIIEQVNEKSGLTLEYEGYFKSGLFLSKKRYALLDEDNNLKVRGIELVRRDWAPVVGKTQREVLLHILKGEVSRAWDVYQDTYRRIRDGDIDLSELVIRATITRPLEDYKVATPHTNAAKELIKAGIHVGVGDVVKYVITRNGSKISERAKPVELTDPSEIDYKYYADDQLKPAMTRIFSVISTQQTLV